MGNTSFLERGIQAVCLHACPSLPLMLYPSVLPVHSGGSSWRLPWSPFLKGNLRGGGWRGKWQPSSSQWVLGPQLILRNFFPLLSLLSSPHPLLSSLKSPWLTCGVTKASQLKCPGESLLITSFPVCCCPGRFVTAVRGVPRGIQVDRSVPHTSHPGPTVSNTPTSC